MNLKIKNTNIYVYIFLILILYTTSSIYQLVYNGTSTISKLLVIIFGFSAPFIVGSFKQRSKCFAYVFFIIFILLANMLITSSSIYNVVMYCMRFLGIYLFASCCIQKKIDITNKLYKLVILIAIFYLLMYFIFEIGIFNFPSRSILVVNEAGNMNDRFVSNYGYLSYYGIFFSNQPGSLLGLSFRRLNGPFTEPGLYQIILDYALFYFLFIKKNRKKYEILIIVASIIFCNSTMGYLIAIIQCVIFFFKKINLKTILCLVPVAIVCIYLITIILKEKVASISYVDRIRDLDTMLNLIKNSVLFGSGFNKGAYTSNGLLTIMSSFGIWSLFILYPLYKSVEVFSLKEKKHKIVFWVYLTLSLMNEPIGLANFTLFLISLGIVYMFRKRCYYDNYCYSNIQKAKVPRRGH